MSSRAFSQDLIASSRRPMLSNYLLVQSSKCLGHMENVLDLISRRHTSVRLKEPIVDSEQKMVL